MPFTKLPGLQKYTLVLVTCFLAFVFIIPTAAIWQTTQSDPKLVEIGEQALTYTDELHMARVINMVYAAELRLGRPGGFVWTSAYTPSPDRDNTTRDRLYNHLTLALLARRSGVHVSEERMKAHMAELFEKNGGRKALTDQLDTAGVDQNEFIDGVREVLAIEQMLSYVFAHYMKKDYQSAFDALVKEGRRYDFRMVRLTRADLGAAARSEAEIGKALRDFYQDNKELFGKPARVMFELVTLNRPEFRVRVEEGVTRKDLEAFLDKEDNRKKVGERLRTGGAHRHGRDAERTRERVKPWPPENDKKKPGAKKQPDPAKQPAPKNQPAGKKKQAPEKDKPADSKVPSKKELLAEHEELVQDIVVDERVAAEAKAAWDRLGAALTRDPDQSLKRLATGLGLSYRRSEGYVERSKLRSWTSEFGDKLAEQLFELAPGKTSALTSGPAGASYRVRVLDRLAKQSKRYSELTRDELLKAYYAQHEASFQTDAVYEFDFAGALFDSWARPVPLSTGELKAFYTEHAKALFEGQSFEQARDEVERLASRGRLAAHLKSLIGAVHQKVKKTKKAPPMRGRRQPPVETQDVAAQLRADLKGLAMSGGLMYRRFRLPEKELNEHPLFAGKLSGMNFQNQQPGWLSELIDAGDRLFLVRLVSTEKASPKPFEKCRDEVIDRLLAKQLEKALEEKAKALRADLEKDFSGGAAKHGLEVLSFKEARRASDLDRLPEDERQVVFGSLPKLTSQNEISDVLYTEGDDKTAFILQLTRDRSPGEDEIHSFAIKQKAEQQLASLYRDRVYRLWFNPQWYITSGYGGFKRLVPLKSDQPKEKVSKPLNPPRDKP